MKKRLLIMSLLALAGTALAGCNKTEPQPDPEHTHTFATEWSKDENKHWHAATCGHDVKDKEGNHIDGNTDGKCDVCEYQMAVEESPLGLLHIYSGRYEKITPVEGCSEADFNRALLAFFSDGPTDFRESVVNRLASYERNDGKSGYNVLYEGKMSIDSKENGIDRVYDGKAIKTYLVNKYETTKLCEFGKDPNSDDAVYHFYKVTENNEVMIHNIFNEGTYSSGSPAVLKIHDTGITFSNKQLRIGLNVSIMVGTEEAEHEIYEANTAIIYDDGTQSEVQITKQPQDLHVNYPDKFSFSVEVNHPELVESYRWYTGAFTEDQAGSFGPIMGERGAKATLDMPSIGPAQSAKPFKCLITTRNGEIWSDVATLYVDNTDEDVPCVWVLDYPITLGQTLDLATTPYGTGTITFASFRYPTVTFENVNFSNKVIDSDLQSIGLEMENWHNSFERIDFQFIGQNVWMNDYWEEDNHQGGFGFFFHFPVSQGGVIPTLRMFGDPITFIGGTRAISGDVDLEIENNITIVGLPGRFTSGIYAHSITVRSGAVISGSIGGNLLYTSHSDSNVTGFILIEDDARVTGSISPGKVSVGGTQIFGIFAIEKLTIKKAIIDLVICPDYAYFESTKQGIMPLIALHSENSWVYTDGADVSIKIKPINVPASDIGTLVNTAQGISAIQVELWNSKVSIEIDSSSFMAVCGINSVLVTIKNTSLDVYAHGSSLVSGIVSNLRFYNQQEEKWDSKITVIESKVNVVAIADEYHLSEVEEGVFVPYYVDAGIRAYEFDFQITGDNFINIETNRASAIVATYDHVQGKVVPQEGYVAKHILFDKVSVVTPKTYIVNQSSYNTWNEEEQNYDVAYEAMYTDNTYENYITHVTLVANAE